MSNDPNSDWVADAGSPSRMSDRMGKTVMERRLETALTMSSIGLVQAY